MTNFRIEESENAEDYLVKPEVLVGDTIEIMSNNQLGYKKYKVVLSNGNKSLRILADWGNEIYEGDNISDDDDLDDDDATVIDDTIVLDDNANTQPLYGGKRRYKRRKSSRKSKKSKKSRRKSRKSRKSRRKSRK